MRHSSPIRGNFHLPGVWDSRNGPSPGGTTSDAQSYQSSFGGGSISPQRRARHSPAKASSLLKSFSVGGPGTGGPGRRRMGRRCRYPRPLPIDRFTRGGSAAH